MAVAAPARTRTRRVAPARVPPPDRRRGESPPAPRHLRPVSDARVVALKRRRRVRAAILATFVVMMGSLFALAAFHAMLASGQARLDTLESQVSDARSEYEHLRLEVAELEAPARIVREAQERLGMVPPPDVTYLTASQAVASEVGHAAGGDADLATRDAGDRAAWASVKPYLTGRP